jgi:hypothetical protein
MNITQVLFEPIPIGRIGVAADTTKVIFANDYSCFGKMLEEYIGHGAVSIVIPSSSPESKNTNDMPMLLQNRIRVINDEQETEAIMRLFHGVCSEFGITTGADLLQLHFPREMPVDLKAAIQATLSNTRRLLISYNHQVQAEVNVELAITLYRKVRSAIVDPNTRMILAQLEGLLRHYEQAEYQALAPRSDSAQDLINMFDQLVNDPLYIKYSEACAQISLSSTRGRAISKLRELCRSISSKKYVGVVWDYATKVVKVWPGIHMPESKELAIFADSKQLPQFINLQSARLAAVQDWKSSGLSRSPLNRLGQPIGDKKVYWLPPFESMEVASPHSANSTLCKISELIEALEQARDALGVDDVDPA